MAVAAFVHKKSGASDTEMKAEADEHFAGSRPKQVIAKMIVLLRAGQLPSMTDKDMHNRFPPTERMKWYEQRADLRRDVLIDLLHTPEHMARRRNLMRQAEDIEEALVEDITYKQYEEAFRAEDLATYGDGDAYIRFFVEGFDWTKSDEKSRALIGVLLNEFLAAPGQLKPALTHLQARRALSSVAWQTHVPTDLRAKVDDARLAKQAESPREPFTAKDEMEIVTMLLLAKHLPLEELKPLFLAAMEALGFEMSTPKPEDTQPSAVQAEKTEAAAPQDPETPDKPQKNAVAVDGVATPGGPLVLDFDEEAALEAAVTMDGEDPESDGTKVFARNPFTPTVDTGAFEAARASSPASTGPDRQGIPSSKGDIRLSDLTPVNESQPTPPPRPSQSGLLESAPSSRREPPKIVPPLRNRAASKS